MSHPHRHWPWDPIKWPFRVTFTRPGTYYGRYVSPAYTFATADEARAFMAEQHPMEPKGCKARLERAVTPEGSTWAKNGHWAPVR